MANPGIMGVVFKDSGRGTGFDFNGSLDLQKQIEELASKLRGSNQRMQEMEAEQFESSRNSQAEISKLQDDLRCLRDKYDRLFDAHRKVQRLNSNLEDNLLKLTEKFDSDRQQLTRELRESQMKLVEARQAIIMIEDENERYRTDCNLAVQLLQCKPSNFIAHKLNTLPLDLKERLRLVLSQEELHRLECAEKLEEDPKPQPIRIPVSTFPPTAIVYHLNQPTTSSRSTSPVPPNGDSGTVCPSVVGKVLEQRKPVTRELSTRFKLPDYICRQCYRDLPLEDRGVQTCADPSEIEKSGHIILLDRRIPLAKVNSGPRSLSWDRRTSPEGVGPVVAKPATKIQPVRFVRNMSMNNMAGGSDAPPADRELTTT